MSEAPTKRITLLQADKLLQPGPTVHVLRQNAGQPKGAEAWSRTRALATLATHGARLSGPEARAANHGVACAPAPGNWLFFETAHE